MTEAQSSMPPGNPYKKQLRDLKMLWNVSGKAKDLYGIERCALIGLSAFLMLMPTMLLRWLAGLKGLHARKIAVEVYAILKPSLLIYILWAGHWINAWACAMAILFLVDLYAYLLGIVFMRDFWSRPFSYTRSLLLLGINLVEFVAAFAVLYLFYGGLISDGCQVKDWSAAFYFSVVTMATVGYGDITPAPGIGRGLATIQIFASLGFLAIIVAHFVGNIEHERKPVR